MLDEIPVGPIPDREFEEEARSPSKETGEGGFLFMTPQRPIQRVLPGSTCTEFKPGFTSSPLQRDGTVFPFLPPVPPVDGVQLDNFEYLTGDHSIVSQPHTQVLVLIHYFYYVHSHSDLLMHTIFHHRIWLPMQSSKANTWCL